MNLKFRKALSLLCAISMLLTSIPFLVISEESVDGIDAPANLPEQVMETAEEAGQDTPPDAGSEETEPAEAPAVEEPEQDVSAASESQDETPSEPEAPVQEEVSQDPSPEEGQADEATNEIDLPQEEEVQNPQIEMDDSGDRVVDFEEEQAQVVAQVEIAGVTQAFEPQSIPEEDQNDQPVLTQEEVTDQTEEEQQEETVETETVNETEQTQEVSAQEETPEVHPCV